MASITKSENGEVTKKLAPKKKKIRERKLKVNVRCYSLRSTFKHAKEFEDWITRESAKAPWYLCSTYKAGPVLKRIYACSFRKRLGYKKCERQLMVLFNPNGYVEVMDSNEDPKHIHYPIDASEESKQLRTVIVLRSPAEFSSWMAKQRERFAWHRRAGRRSFANIDYYQCASIGSDGRMCKRVMHVEYTPENGVVVKELENLPPHDNVPAHRKPFNGPVKNLKRQKRADSDTEYLPSTSATKQSNLRTRRSMFDTANFGLKRELKDEDDEKNMEGNETEANDASAKSAATPSIEDFVIIPDDEYEVDGSNDCDSTTKSIQVKKELDSCDASFKSSLANGSSKTRSLVDRDNDSTSSSRRRFWKNGLELGQEEVKNSRLDRDSKYNLENFAEELANKLSKTPLERMAEIRESVRREMDEVFAQQIVKEIISRSYSAEARREVLDRIREALRPS